MTTTELSPVLGHTVGARRRRRAESDVTMRSGRRISASAARKLLHAVPQNSRDARATAGAPTTCGATPTAGRRASPTPTPRSRHATSSSATGLRRRPTTRWWSRDRLVEPGPL